MSTVGRTLRDFLASGYELHAFCSNHFNCHHTGPVRTEALIQRLGWEFPFDARRKRLLGVLYCSVCGTYYPDIVISPISRREPGAWLTHPVADPVPMDEATRRWLDLSRKAHEHERDAGYDQRPWRGQYRKFGPGAPWPSQSTTRAVHF